MEWPRAGRPVRWRDCFALPCGAFDFGRRDAYAVALLEDLTGGHRLSIDSDQVIARLAVGNPFGEKPFDGRALGDFDMVGETCAIVVDEENDQLALLLVKRCVKTDTETRFF